MQPLSPLGTTRSEKKTKQGVARGGRGRLLPRRVGRGRFLGAACGAQDPEHVGEGAAIGGLGDEDGSAHEEDEEGDAQAHGGDDVAQVEAEVLLDVGHAPQREDGPQVDAPVEPVEEPARRLRSSVLDLKKCTETDAVFVLMHGNLDLVIIFGTGMTSSGGQDQTD